jgi:hypothetical protein
MREVLLALTLDAWSGGAEVRGWTQLQLDDVPHMGHWAAAMVAASVGPTATVGAYTMTLTAMWTDDDNVMTEHSVTVAGGLDGDTAARQHTVCSQLVPLFDEVLFAIPTEVLADATTDGND